MGEERGPACPVCSRDTAESGTKYSSFSRRSFTLRRCGTCAFAFVSDPRLDFDALYDERYYRGEGADPLVDYLYEAEWPDRTIRRYEWRGILKVVSRLTPVGPDTRWLDYGCGTGGLVDFLRSQGFSHAVGYEPGWTEGYLREKKRPHVTSEDLSGLQGTFDVISLIEVIEHALDPVAELTRVRSLLRPGGLCFLTTGNAAPYRDRLVGWRYVVPEIHVSYFEPDTLATALRRAGLEPTFPGYVEGWDDILRFKILKGLHRRSRGGLLDAAPWGPVSRYTDHRLKLTAHPIGWARDPASPTGPAA